MKFPRKFYFYFEGKVFKAKRLDKGDYQVADQKVSYNHKSKMVIFNGVQVNTFKNRKKLCNYLANLLGNLTSPKDSQKSEPNTPMDYAMAV